jgi:zinc protease
VSSRLRSPAGPWPSVLSLALLFPAGAESQAAFDRKKPPVLPKVAPLAVPSVSSRALPNGLQLSVVEHHELPLVQISVNIVGGARLDGTKPGVAAFTANMLDEGAGARDAVALQSELAFLGASLGTGADWDRFTVNLKVPARSLQPALDILADVLMRPTFASAEVRRQRDLRLGNLLQLRDQPNAVADLAFNQTLFPAGHPYHRNLQGDSASTAALDSASVRAFYDASLRPERTSIVVVGDITPAAAEAAVRSRLGQWRALGSAAAIPRIAPTLAPQAVAVYLVDKPNAPQSVIYIGGPGVERRSADYPALTVMNTLLGGSFTSRLNMNLRETKGYTYGASSRFAWRLSPGPFVASAAVRTNVTDSSLVEFFKELRIVRDSLAPTAELERARAYVELGIPQSLESTSQIANQVTQLGLFGLPLEELRDFSAKVRAVTAQDVQRVARQYLPIDRPLIIVVGDMSKIRAPIEALNLGSIEVLDIKTIAR